MGGGFVRGPIGQASRGVSAAVLFLACVTPVRAQEAAPPDLSCSAETSDLSHAVARIDSLLIQRRRAAEIPGLAAGVVCGDELAWSAGYGVVALDDPRPVRPTTLFRIASLTKVFTATAVMKLVAGGALELDDPVRRHLPWFEIGRPPDVEPGVITIRHLLTHTSGLPRDSRLTDFSRLYQPSRDEAIAALSAQRLQAAPGARNAYSNLGYGLLGEVIAAAAESSYESYLDRAILEPLGMDRTLVHPRPADDTAWGHGPRREGRPRARAGFWELGFATPAGGMASSVVDLSAFVRLHLAPCTGGPQTLLPHDLLRRMHQVQFTVDPERGGSGLGWAVETSSGQHLVYHGGELPEQTSFMLLDLRTGIGIVLLTNAQAVDANGIAQEMLSRVREAVLGSDASFPRPAIPPAE